MERIASLDFDRMSRDGFTILQGLVQPAECAAFEREIEVVGDRLAAQRGIQRNSDEAIADVLIAAGPHRAMLFDHIKRLFSLTRLSVEIGSALERAGLFRHAGIAVPIVWPTLRADLPGEGTYELPLHQDYGTTRCRTAWRMWIPLRAVDRHHGTMEVVPCSHRNGGYRYVQDQPGSPFIERSDLAERSLVTQVLELPAGDSVLFNPWLVHASVPNRSRRTKWVLLLHIQDLTEFVNPDDPADPVYPFLELTRRSRTPAPPAKDEK
jgi:ectoine hydroxylase-related dioxygenase (phytanoyl-CoA dioxygenase family)